ncbi:MAG: hypothetical protein ACK5NG_10145 [Chthoniobacterales bacterium]
MLPFILLTPLAAESENQVFQDGFDVSGLFIENFTPESPERWKVEEGVLEVENAGTQGTKLNLPLSADCRVEADVAVLPGEEHGFAGLSVNGALFLLRPDGFSSVYKNEGDERSSGHMTKRKIKEGDMYRIEVSRRAFKGGWHFSWAVDGETMGEFTQTKSDEDPGYLSLVASRRGARFDNVAVYSVEGGTASSNTVMNSSFEYLLEDYPIYWKGLNRTVMLDKYGSHENFWKTFHVDNTVFHSGKQSLRIEVNEEVPQNGFASHRSSVLRGKPFTFSVWMKADREMPAEMTVWEVFGENHKKKITVGTEWERYSFSIKNAEKARVECGVRFETPGVVWIDDAQVEAGSLASEYAASTGDAGLAQNENTKPKGGKSYLIPEGGNGDALVLEDFAIIETDKAPEEKTTAKLWIEKDNLNIAFSCFTKHMSELKSSNAETLDIAQGDCVEVFLDITGEKKNYLHLFINPEGGALLADFNHKLGWNPAWDVKTSKQDDRWDVEIKIPLASLSGATSRWGINLARHNPHTLENSCTSRVGGKHFSDVVRYDEFAFPANVTFAPPPPAKKVQEKALYTERNFYMNEPEAVLIATLPAGDVTLQLKSAEGETLWSQTEKAQAGKNRFVIPLKEIPDGDYLVDLGGGKTVPLVKRPFLKGATQIDQSRLCLLVDGKPFFVFAPLLDAPTTPLAVSVERMNKMLKYMADAGFKTVSVVSAVRGENPPDFWKNVLDESDKLGLKVLAWPAGFGAKFFNADAYDPIFEEVREHPALLAWCVVDEPELHSKPEDVIEFHKKIRKLDPYHPVIMNNTSVGIPSRFADLDTDVLSIDDYITNRERRTVAGILDNVAVMTEVGRELRKPSIMFLTGGNYHNHYRESTSGELVAQTYGSVIEGTAGTWYFLGVPGTRKGWEAYTRTNKELLSLTDVLFSGEEVENISSDQKAVISITRKHGGKTYLITTNIENKPVTAGFRLPEGVSAASVQFEDREVEVKDGILRDSYEPHSRHIYVF